MLQVYTLRMVEETDWGKQREINKGKEKILQGIYPDLKECKKKVLKMTNLKKGKEERLKLKKSKVETG